MFRNQLAHRLPPRRPAQRKREPAGGLRFRTSQDFSVRAYQHFNAGRARTFGAFQNAVLALGRIAGSIIRHLLDAMYESRRRQAVAVLSRYGHLIDAEGQCLAPVFQKPARASEGNDMSFRTSDTVDQAVRGMRIRCAITGAPCEGDRAYLCVELGCARKVGISPISHENA